MARSDALRVVAQLVAIYGQEQITEDRVNAYVDNLGDIDGDLLWEAHQRIIKASRFFPSVSEIRHEAASIAGLLPLSKAEAVSVIRRADKSESKFRRDGSLAYVERYWEWPPDVDPRSLVLIQAALAKVGEPVNADGKAHFGWEMGFQETYAKEADEVSRQALADLSQARLPESTTRLLRGDA